MGEWLLHRLTRCTLHLSGWKDICDLFSHSSRSLRSFCKMAASVSLVTATIYTIVSSANSRTLDCNLAGRSFIYTKNSIGPITYPWGTPLVTGTHEDISPSHTTLCCCWCKKLYPLIDRTIDTIIILWACVLTSYGVPYQRPSQSP